MQHFIILLQGVAELPIRQWTLQDVLLITGAVVNISMVAGLGAVALHRLGSVERESANIRNRVEINRQEIADSRTEIAKLELSTRAAHHRLDAMAPHVVDMKEVIRIAGTYAKTQEDREKKTDRLLEELVRRSN